MKVIHFFVAPDGVHIGINALADGKAVNVKRHPLPLCKRMNNGGCLARFLYIKRNGALNSVQVVVESRFRLDEKRRRNADKIKRVAQLFLEHIVNDAYRGLRLIQSERTFVPLRNECFAHINLRSKIAGFFFELARQLIAKLV